MESEEVLHAAAANLAGWHDCSIRALGFETTTGPWWWTAPTPSPWIYFTAIQLHRPASRAERRAALDELRRHLDDPRGSFEAACETFGALSLDKVGLDLRSRGRWYLRTADGPPMLEAASGADALVISEVQTADDLAAFERATCAAFAAPPPVAPFDIHAPAILDDAAMHVLIGRTAAASDAESPVVAGAMAYVRDGVVGIYGVGTVPGHRGHGHATALTAACLAIAPDLPTTLQPSAEAASLYRRLGFTDIGPFTHWG